MKLGILETGKVPENLANRYSTYPSMFEQILKPFIIDLEITIYDVLAGDLPHDPESQDGWLITGSPAGVYEDHIWIDPLSLFIRHTHTAQIPLIGICFGHQLIAQALGGFVAKSEKGWGVGLHTYNLANSDETFGIFAMHQDQVQSAPEGATVYASSEFCPIAGFTMGQHILTLQPHPEFNAQYTYDLIESRRASRIPENVADPAMNSLENYMVAPHAGKAAQWIADVLCRQPIKINLE